MTPSVKTVNTRNILIVKVIVFIIPIPLLSEETAKY